eukprot:GEMP01055026.1.p3 GENE.GEMP01055026.1~~GEMP01055026.1.p3  ORF type:complete len:105 (+),score=26.15 GEMP01055026.1:161-475(+)
MRAALFFLMVASVGLEVHAAEDEHNHEIKHKHEEKAKHEHVTRHHHSAPHAPKRAPLPITAPVFTGYLIAIVWLIIFFSGFCCLFQLQTPQQFADKGLSLHKEF